MVQKSGESNQLRLVDIHPRWLFGLSEPSTAALNVCKAYQELKRASLAMFPPAMQGLKLP